MKKILSLYLFISLILLSCNHYEYGPNVSFRTKKGRLSNEWKVNIAFKNGIEMTDSLQKFEISFEKDGKVKKTNIYTTSNGTDSLVTQTGLWEFDNDAENVLILLADRFGITESHIWRILKLTKDEFWFEEIVNSDLHEYHLVEK
jgi:hypothetical protein